MIRPRNYSRGEHRHSAKLTEAQVRELRARRAAGVKLSLLASEFGICDSQAGKIAKGKRWRHVGAA